MLASAHAWLEAVVVPIRLSMDGLFLGAGAALLPDASVRRMVFGPGTRKARADFNAKAVVLIGVVPDLCIHPSELAGQHNDDTNEAGSPGWLLNPASGTGAELQAMKTSHAVNKQSEA